MNDNFNYIHLDVNSLASSHDLFIYNIAVNPSIYLSIVSIVRLVLFISHCSPMFRCNMQEWLKSQYLTLLASEGDLVPISYQIYRSYIL